LRAVLFGGEFERPAKQLNIARRTSLPDFLDQFEETRLQRARRALGSAADERGQAGGLFH